MREKGITAVELHLDAGFDTVTQGDLSGFSYISVHAPKHDYRNNAETRELLGRIAALHARAPLSLVLFHPDVVAESDMLEGLPFPIGFENMDSRKSMGQQPEDLRPLLERFPESKFVFDVNHIMTNDPTMALAEEFYRVWGHRLGQVHISGFGGFADGQDHVPLFKTKQTEIIKAAARARAPFIIESALSLFDDIVQESAYINEVLAT